MALFWGSEIFTCEGVIEGMWVGGGWIEKLQSWLVVF